MRIILNKLNKNLNKENKIKLETLLKTVANEWNLEICNLNIQTNHNPIVLKIIIKKLISQANLFEGYHSSPLNTKSIFFKSHHRFFIYLKHNFLKTYLKKISIDE